MANLPTTNNNPGDLRDVGQSGATQGAGGFAQFSDPAQGTAALMNDLQDKINTHPDWTLADFSNIYAPKSDGNDPVEYTLKLANQLGVAPNTSIGSLKPNIGKFAEAVANNEGYQGGSTSITQNPGQVDNNTTQSNTSNLDAVLGLTGAGIGILGLTLPWLLGPEA
jgi:hypothetical protein